MTNKQIENFIEEVKNSLQKMAVVTSTETAKLIGERNKLLRKSIEIIESLQKEKQSESGKSSEALLSLQGFPSINIPESLFKIQPNLDQNQDNIEKERQESKIYG